MNWTTPENLFSHPIAKVKNVQSWVKNQCFGTNYDPEFPFFLYITFKKMLYLNVYSAFDRMIVKYEKLN